MTGRRDPAPRAELHQLEDDTVVGVLAFVALFGVAAVLLVRAHPWWAAGMAVLVGGIVITVRRVRAAWRDRRARADDPPAPGVVIGHVVGDWPGARPRPFRLPWTAFRQHVLIAGPTGRGKTFTFIEPLLRAQLTRRGTGVFYLDGKGDPIHRQVGFDAVFCPEWPEQSARWNPLAGADPVQAANLFAAGLFPEAGSLDAPGAFYAARAVHAITRVAPAMAHTGYGTGLRPRVKLPANEDEAVKRLTARGVQERDAERLVRKKGVDEVGRQLAYLAERPPERQTPEQLVEAIRREWPVPPAAPVVYDINLSQLSRVLFSAERLQELKDAVSQDRVLAGAAPHASTLAQLQHDLEAFLTTSERERAAVLQSLQNRLGRFLEPPFIDLCASSDFAISSVADGARMAFLLPTGRFPTTARPLGRVALSQFKNAVLASTPEREKVAVLDEFHNFVDADFTPFLNQARSRGGAAIMALQSLGDLPRDEADAMLANISTLVVTPGCRPHDAEYFAEAFGKEFMARHTVSYEAPSALELLQRPLIKTQHLEDYRFTPTEIAELDPREALMQVTAGRRSWPATRVIVERAHG